MPRGRRREFSPTRKPLEEEEATKQAEKEAIEQLEEEAIKQPEDKKEENGQEALEEDQKPFKRVPCIIVY